jgi:hypothetical protein
VADEADYHRRVGEQLEEFVRTDPVTSASVTSDRSSTSTIDATLKAIAEEAAALLWIREHLPVGSREAERASSRRTDALGRLSTLVVEMHRHQPDELNVRTDKFQKVVELFLVNLTQAAEETLGQAEAERFLGLYRARLAGWEDKFDSPLGGRSG